MTHTPGPWRYVQAEEGVVEQDVIVAGLDDLTDGDIIVTGFDRQDAHLIAATPDLYEALENLAGDVYLYSLAGDGPEGREIGWEQVLKTQGEALRALAKARGET